MTLETRKLGQTGLEASAVALGGALVTDTARRILLGELNESGRYYVDMHQIIQDGKSIEVEDPGPVDIRVAHEALREPSIPTVKRGNLSVTDEEMRQIIEFVFSHDINPSSELRR